MDRANEMKCTVWTIGLPEEPGNNYGCYRFELRNEKGLVIASPIFSSIRQCKAMARRFCSDHKFKIKGEIAFGSRTRVDFFI